WFRTHCARMDHGGCGLWVGVRDNRIVKIKGDPEGYLNRGYVCPKGLASPERLTHPDRLTQPLRRRGKRGGGDWEAVSWDEALEEIARRLGTIREREGARAVAFGVGMPKGLEHFVLIRLANLFGSPNVVASQDVCHAPREVSGLHTCGFYPVADFHHSSRLVILWGSNITATNEEGEICSLLLEQVKGGTELIVVDPRRTELADRAALWLPVRPGTDHALALGLLHVIVAESLYDHGFVEQYTEGFEDLAEHLQGYTPEHVEAITRVPAGMIRKAARRYAGARPAAIQWGNPIEHHRFTFDVTRALLCLMAVTGNLDVPGGNVHARDPEIMPLGRFVRADLIPDKRKTMLGAQHRTIPRMMTVPPSFFKQAVLEETPYPVRGLYMMCGNPMLSWADSRQTRSALEKLEFLAVADLFMTPTAAMADMVLPVATQFEFNDIGHYGIGHGLILARPRVVDPPPGCRPDMRILNELGRRLSPAELWHEDYEDFLEDVLAPSGLTYAEFAERGYLKGPEAFGRYSEEGFRTPTGKVELRLSTAGKFGLPALPSFQGPPVEEDPDYPLVLTSSKNPNFLHSSYRWVESLRRRCPDPELEMHPETAERFGVTDGGEVVIETRHGTITHRARVTERVSPGVVIGGHGWWFPEDGPDGLYGWERSNFNMLTSIHALGREFGTPNIKGIPCRIRPGAAGKT
ncbi:MAG: molybdopterin-dependent oxidoreductase, partial [Deltaproteobacteria bacterium]|nr:molybdopterin-dependent oxidoreductase [Deltaproteobacteria bacterium]